MLVILSVKLNGNNTVFVGSIPFGPLSTFLEARGGCNFGISSYILLLFLAVVHSSFATGTSLYLANICVYIYIYSKIKASETKKKTSRNRSLQHLLVDIIFLRLGAIPFKIFPKTMCVG